MSRFHPGVATGHRLVTEAAAQMLKEGGNAFDAAAAAGFAGAVVEPALTSLGGGGFLLARTSDGKAALFDFFVDTPGRGRTGPAEPHFFPVVVKFPGSEQIFNIGLGSVAVPGNLAGLLHVHRLLGRLPLKEVIAPAALFARKGVELNAHQAYFLDLLRPIMLHSEEGRRLYLKEDGSYVSEGDVVRYPDLAAFLDELAATDGDAARDIYQGMTGRRVVQDMELGHGLLTMEDLEQYRVVERRPLETGFRGRRLLTNPPPSFGGFFISICLELLDRLPLEECSFGDLCHLPLLAEAMREVEGYRKETGTRLVHPDEKWFSEKASAIMEEAAPAFTRGTTHVSITDDQGNAASMTTSNGEGSGYFIPGTGIMLNNMMGEDDLHPEGFHSAPPGVRVASMMSPSMLLNRGEVELVLGSGGSKRIRTAITQVLINWAAFSMDVEQAVISPRIHYDGELLQVEPGFSPHVLEGVSDRFKINLWQTIDVYFGGVHAVDPLGGMAAGDPRRGGAAVVL